MKRLRPLILCLALALVSCAQADVPNAHNVNVPAPAAAHVPDKAVNDKPDSVMYLPLGNDVLVPSINASDPLPTKEVGPFELRGETLAGALQLILADYDVPLAFQTDEGLNRRITVANLKGPLNKVVNHVCGLANLYCDFQDGMLTVKDTQTFTVKVPPISQDTSFMDNVATGLAAIIGKAPIVDKSTRTIIYEATNRNAEMAERYFQRMRSATALIVFETYIWEVSLNTGNSTGINWDAFAKFGKFGVPVSIPGTVGTDFTNPISIGLPHLTSESNLSPTNIVSFLSTYGAVKTVSQPQITVLSGSQAKLRAADKQNYVSKVAQTLDNGLSTTSVDTDSVDTGFTITIDSAWDNATVYAAIAISLTDVASIENFNFSSGTTGGATTVQLPRTTEREVNTQVRIRPGDSLLLAGLVTESDNLNTTGPGVTMTPIVPTSRTATASNLELVVMMRPRVVVFTSPSDEDYLRSVRKPQDKPPPDTPVADAGKTQDASGQPPPPTKGANKDITFNYDFSPIAAAAAPGNDQAANAPAAPKHIIPPKASVRHQASISAAQAAAIKPAAGSATPLAPSNDTAAYGNAVDPAGPTSLSTATAPDVPATATPAEAINAALMPAPQDTTTAASAGPTPLIPGLPNPAPINASKLPIRTAAKMPAAPVVQPAPLPNAEVAPAPEPVAAEPVAPLPAVADAAPVPSKVPPSTPSKSPPSPVVADATTPSRASPKIKSPYKTPFTPQQPNVVAATVPSAAALGAAEMQQAANASVVPIASKWNTDRFKPISPALPAHNSPSADQQDYNAADEGVPSGGPHADQTSASMNGLPVDLIDPGAVKD